MSIIFTPFEAVQSKNTRKMIISLRDCNPSLNISPKTKKKKNEKETHNTHIICNRNV